MNNTLAREMDLSKNHNQNSFLFSPTLRLNQPEKLILPMRELKHMLFIYNSSVHAINIKILLRRVGIRARRKGAFTHASSFSAKKENMCQLGNLFCGFARAPLNQRLGRSGCA